MKFKVLATTLITASLLSACSTITPSKNNNTHTTASKAEAQQPVIFKEPELPKPFYALNPSDYDAPSKFEIDLKKADAQPVTKMVVTSQQDPSKTVTLDVNHLIIPTIDAKKPEMTYAPLAGQNQLDVTAIDDFIQMVEGQARHYPPQFTSKNVRRGFENKLRQVSQELDKYAAKDNASYDILLRAFKTSVLARNLDLGPQFTTKSLTYGQRLLKITPNDPLVNFWFGFNLSEGGGQREAIPYLDKAIKGGVQEAYLSAANNYLYLEHNKNAITTLRNYKLKYPEETQVVERLIKEIQTQGRTNVWENLADMKKGRY